MSNYTLLRKLDDTHGTFGRLYDGAGTELCRIVERPWKDNQKKISCIPVGKYKLGLYPYGKKFYPKYKKLFAAEGNDRGMIILNDVPGRTSILIHRGNYPTDSWGCLLVNKSVGRNDDGELQGYTSTAAYREIYPVLAHSVELGETWLEVTNGW